MAKPREVSVVLRCFGTEMRVQNLTVSKTLVAQAKAEFGHRRLGHLSNDTVPRLVRREGWWHKLV
jgi:hypothetical protein